MHEVELATRVLDALRRLAAEKKARVLEVNLRVGELNEPRALKLWLKKLGGEEFGLTKFNIASVPLTISCKCGYSGGAKAVNPHLPEPELGIACPKCGGHEISLTTGRELEFVGVKLREIK